MMEQELTKFLTFWDHLNENEKELLKQNATLQTYAKGITMHRGSDDCLGVVLVRKGQLRTYMLSPDGRDITLYRLFAGDVCILSASCVLETITFDVFIDIMWAMQQILFMSVDKRLAIFLKEEAEKNNSLELKITHEQIAKYMATAREVVTRMLKYFSQEGIVKISRGKITIVDKHKLDKLTID